MPNKLRKLDYCPICNNRLTNTPSSWCQKYSCYPCNFWEESYSQLEVHYFRKVGDFMVHWANDSRIYISKYFSDNSAQFVISIDQFLPYNITQEQLQLYMKFI